jgi:hypothetical protein
MRNAVVKQMKNPIEKSTTSPIFEPKDMLSLMITGMGRIKIARSVRRLRLALDHL